MLRLPEELRQIGGHGINHHDELMIVGVLAGENIVDVGLVGVKVEGLET